jgi:carbon-monoxide dehydrogenase large subunit
MVTAAEQPTPMITGPTLDRMGARETLDRAMALIDYAGFREEQRRAREQGRLKGLGIATFIEAAPGPPDMGKALGFGLGPERAQVRIEPSGQVMVTIALPGQGQGHETVMAQVCAERLGARLEDMRVVQGDTFAESAGGGTIASRVAVMAGNAVADAAGRVRAKALAAAAELLEAAAEDLEIADGVVQPAGSPSRARCDRQAASVWRSPRPPNARANAPRAPSRCGPQASATQARSPSSRASRS